jgi:hypothetical protein
MNEFVLYAIDIEPYEEELIDVLCEEYKEAKYALSGEATIWLDHEKDMKEFSNHYEDFVFTLYGQGTEAPDVWIKHFKNGKMQYCPAIITFDDFDEGKLK